MISFINLAKSVIKAVQNNNKANPEVKTADESVFKDLEKHVEAVDNDYDMTSTNSRADAYKEMRRRMEEVQHTNEADPHVETADKSVFEEMQKQIEELQRKIENQSSDKEVPRHQTDHTQPSPPQDGMLAFVNGMGGSLALRTEPSMGASQIDFRVPDNATVKVIQHSDQSIILDGKKSTFVYVEYNGTRGWILDSYLNR